jgi:hypothetical protein
MEWLTYRVWPLGGSPFPHLGRFSELRTVAVSQLSNEDATFHRFVDEPVLRIDPARPITAECMFWRFGLADARIRVADGFL